MRIHRMMMDHETEDKVIGGVFTLRKGIYIALGFCYVSYMFFFNLNFSPMILTLKIITSVIVVVICFAFGFIKKDIYYLDRYLIKKINYKRHRKIAVYRKY